MRFFHVSFAILLAAVATGSARAAECANPGALGTHRTMKVSAAEGPVGLLNYKKTLDLADKEVVLTFDDGPMPKRTPAVLKALADECVKATFFVVGSMAAAHPELLRQEASEGHTIATHTWTHAYLNRTKYQSTRSNQIAGGLQAANIVLGEENRQALSPFFRFPGLGRSKSLDRFVAQNGLIAMSVDVVGDDWRRISPEEVLKRTMARLEQRGKGIVLLHDIQPRTVAMLPDLLKELKAKGYRIVHVTADKAETEVALANLGEPQTRGFQVAMIRTKQKLIVLTAQASAQGFAQPAQSSQAATRGGESFALRGAVR